MIMTNPDVIGVFLIFTLIGILTHLVKGHGMMMDPPGRSSMWRYGYPTEVNNYDNGLNCGGFWHQWGVNKGKCGVCGDPWDAHPRQNEAGGKYAKGIIVRHYREGATITVTFSVTASHRGYFEIRLCPHDNVTTPVTQECLDQHVLKFEDGNTRLPEAGYSRIYTVHVKLPAGVTCSQCVFQWKYVGGNNYGCDKTHTDCCVGCGNQEQFYACADVSIDPHTGTAGGEEPRPVG